MGNVSDKRRRENQNKYFMFSNFFPKIVPFFLDNVEKHCTAGQATYDNILLRMRFVFWVTKATDTTLE
jgi:hypothetical protein